MATGLPGDDPVLRAKALKELVAKRMANRWAPSPPATSKGKVPSIASIQPRKLKS